jgi:hypothetical protein
MCTVICELSCRHLPGNTEKNLENPQSRHTVSGRHTKPGHLRKKQQRHARQRRTEVSERESALFMNTSRTERRLRLDIFITTPHSDFLPVDSYNPQAAVSTLITLRHERHTASSRFIASQVPGAMGELSEDAPPPSRFDKYSTLLGHANRHPRFGPDRFCEIQGLRNQKLKDAANFLRNRTTYQSTRRHVPEDLTVY